MVERSGKTDGNPNAVGRRLSVILAVLVPWLAFVFSAFVEGEWKVAHAPFGFSSVAFVHALTTLPLSVLISVWFGSFSSGRHPFFGVTIGLVLAALTAVFCPTVELTLQGVPAGFFLLRHFWMLMLQLPWTISATAIWEKNWQFVRKIDFLITLSIATLLPYAFGAKVCRAELETIEKTLANRQIQRAFESLTHLRRYGVAKPIHGRTVSELQTELTELLANLKRSVETPLLDPVSDDERFDLAVQLASLDKLQRASDVLTPAALRRPDAAVLLARLKFELGDEDGCLRNSQRAIKQLEESTASDQIDLIRLQAYEMWVEQLRRRARYQQAERVLRNALQTYERIAAGLRFQLGRHYEMGGRPFEAIEQFNLAVDLDANYSSLVAETLKNLSQGTPACLLRYNRTVVNQ